MTLLAFILIYLLIGILLAMVYEAVWLDVLKGRYGVRLGGYHLHHSLFGAVAYLLGSIVVFGHVVSALGLFCLGSGIIVQHALREGHFSFIS